MSRHESPEIAAAIGRMLNGLIRRAAEGDTEALEALAQVEALAPQATTAGLCAARDVYSLGELAAVTGTTRSAVAQRTTGKTHPSSCGHPTCVGVKRCRDTMPTAPQGVMR